MAKKLFYSMGEVSEMFDVNASLIRFWETKFDILRPQKNKKGNRLFSPADVENLKLIYHLVKERGMTLEGAKKALRQQPAEGGMERDAELMERLQRIRALLVEVREEEAMAPIEIADRKRHEYHCGSCMMSLPVETMSALLSHGELTRCVSCGCILYLEESTRETMTSKR